MSCVALLALSLAAGSVEAKADKSSTATFPLKLRAHFVQESVTTPADDSPEVEDESNELKIAGTGTAVAQGQTMTLDVAPFTDSEGNTVTVALSGPLTLAKKGKEYRGQGTATVVVDGVTYSTSVDARVKVRKNKKGEFATVKIKPKSGRGLDFGIKVTGKGVAASGA